MSAPKGGTARRDRSIAPEWFEELYRDRGDPWEFETSAYEQAKYDRTIDSLPRPLYPRGLEIGCSNGVLTRRLAERCDALTAVDVSETALAQARARCADLRHVAFERRRLPAEWPDGSFDLVLLSEVAYYWDDTDLALAADRLREALASGGDLLLVHWLGPTDYPKSGDEAVEALRARLGDAVREIEAERRAEYRLDLWRRV